MFANDAEPLDANLVAQLEEAIRADRADQVRQMLDDHPVLKAGINEPVFSFNAPAIVNARSRAVLDVLLDAGADINAKSNWWAGGFGLLHWASPELAAYAVERGAIVDAHAAARLGMLDRLRELLAVDPELVHARGGDGQTPLHFAGTIEVAAFLLDQGAVIDARDIDHESTPAQYMVNERQDVARYLVARGCSTDILMATALGDIELVRRHLDADSGCIRLRVSDEFFPMVKPKGGGTIYQWTLGFYVSAHQVARKFGRPDVLELLIERSPAAVMLLDACWQGDEATVTRIRAENPGVVQTLSTFDHCQLAYAARDNDTTVVRLMLESGLPLDGRAQHEATALHWAAFHGNTAMTRVLLGFNAPLEVTDADFHSTPVRWAVHGSEHSWHSTTGDYAGTVEALLEAGAKPPEELGGSPPVREVLSHHGVGEQSS